MTKGSDPDSRWVPSNGAEPVPGLLLLVIIGAQMFGAFAWLPIVRRKLRGTGVTKAELSSH